MPVWKGDLAIRLKAKRPDFVKGIRLKDTQYTGPFIIHFSQLPVRRFFEQQRHPGKLINQHVRNTHFVAGVVSQTIVIQSRRRHIQLIQPSQSRAFAFYHAIAKLIWEGGEVGSENPGKPSCSVWESNPQVGCAYRPSGTGQEDPKHLVHMRDRRWELTRGLIDFDHWLCLEGPLVSSCVWAAVQASSSRGSFYHWMRIKECCFYNEIAYLACMDWRGDMRYTKMSHTALASPDVNGRCSSAFWYRTVPEPKPRCHVNP